jgi:hypothetical protein
MISALFNKLILFGQKLIIDIISKSDIDLYEKVCIITNPAFAAWKIAVIVCTVLILFIVVGLAVYFYKKKRNGKMSIPRQIESHHS